MVKFTSGLALVLPVPTISTPTIRRLSPSLPPNLLSRLASHASTVSPLRTVMITANSTSRTLEQNGFTTSLTRLSQRTVISVSGLEPTLRLSSLFKETTVPSGQAASTMWYVASVTCCSDSVRPISACLEPIIAPPVMVQTPISSSATSLVAFLASTHSTSLRCCCTPERMFTALHQTVTPPSTRSFVTRAERALQSTHLETSLPAV